MGVPKSLVLKLEPVSESLGGLVKTQIPVPPPPSTELLTQQGWEDLRMSVSNKFPDGGDAAGPGTPFRESLH